MPALWFTAQANRTVFHVEQSPLLVYCCGLAGGGNSLGGCSILYSASSGLIPCSNCAARPSLACSCLRAGCRAGCGLSVCRADVVLLVHPYCRCTLNCCFSFFKLGHCLYVIPIDRQAVGKYAVPHFTIKPVCIFQPCKQCR